MIIRKLTVGPIMANCFIVGCEETRQAAVILNRAVNRARARVRASTLEQIVLLTHELDGAKVGGQRQVPEAARKRLQFLIDVYLDFAILEERIAQKMPAFEGLFVIKERPSGAA